MALQMKGPGIYPDVTRTSHICLFCALAVPGHLFYGKAANYSISGKIRTGRTLFFAGERAHA